MAKNTAPKKKYNPNRKGPMKMYGFASKMIRICRDEMEELAQDMYARLPAFLRGEATFADRTTMLIRLHTGLQLIEHFEETELRKIIEESILIVDTSRDKVKRRIKKLSMDEYQILTLGMTLTHRMARACTLWEQVQAGKVAEDKYLLGSSEYEYVFMGVVD